MSDTNQEVETCSEIFQDAVCDNGALVHTCELCGRVHFATHATEGFYEAGEREELERKQAAEPGKYVAVDASSVAYGYCGGKSAVFGCACGWVALSRYEGVFWHHRDVIKRYFEKRTGAALKEAQRERDQFGNIPT